MTRDEFETLVTDALTTLPKEFQDVLDNVDVVIEADPSEMQYQKMHLRPSVSLFGLYEGVPKTKRLNYTMVMPDKITIFKHPIERIHRDDEEAIKEQVRKTVLHEIGHHLGMDDKKLRKLKY